jgi:hypothetical protein
MMTDVSAIQRKQPDKCQCAVCFVWRDSAHHSIRIVPRLPSGTVPEYVTGDDFMVTVVVVGDSAVVLFIAGVSGSFDCVCRYTVDEGVHEIDIRISACSVLVSVGCCCFCM